MLPKTAFFIRSPATSLRIRDIVREFHHTKAIDIPFAANVKARSGVVENTHIILWDNSPSLPTYLVSQGPDPVVPSAGRRNMVGHKGKANEDFDVSKVRLSAIGYVCT